MTYVGAQLTALSIPGQGNLLGPYFAPYGAGPGYWYMSGPTFREPFRPYGRVFFGADDPTGFVAPGTGGISVRKHLDDRQVLHVDICVDGTCHSTSMDLAPAIAMLLNKLKSFHEQLHATPPAPDTVVSTIDNAVNAASDLMVEGLVGRHVASVGRYPTTVGSWYSSIGNALGGTLRKLSPVITLVATGVATAYGGPVAGAAAAKLVPVVTNLQANALDPKGDPAKKAAAQQALQQLNQEAATDPVKAQALAAASQAVKNTAVAYHVKDAVDRAAVGDQTAKTDINNLVQAADQGDPGAKSTFEILSTALAQQAMKSEEGAKLWEQITGRGPGQLPSTVSGW